MTRDILEPYFTNPTTENTAAREKRRGDPHVHGRAPFPFSPQDQPPLAPCVPRQYVSGNIAKDIPPTEQRPSKRHTGDRPCHATVVTYHVSRGLYFLNIYKICKAEAHIETDLEFKRTAGIERVNETSASRKWTTALKRKK